MRARPLSTARPTQTTELLILISERTDPNVPRAADDLAVTKRSTRSRDLDQQFAEVLALEQAEERGRRQPVDHILAILEPAAAHPFAGITQEIGLPCGEIPHDEAAQREPLAQH